MPPYNSFVHGHTTFNIVANPGEPPKVRASNVNSRLEVVLEVAWSQSYDGLKALLGTVRKDGSYLKRSLPHCWGSVDPQYPFLYCTEATIVPFQPVASGWLKAHIHATYTVLPYEVVADADMEGGANGPDEGYLQRWVELLPPSTEAKIYHGQGSAWCYTNGRNAQGAIINDKLALDAVDPERPVLVGDPLPQSYEVIRMVWHHVPWTAVPFDAMAECREKVNNAPFGPDGDVRPIGTMLLASAHCERVYACDGMRMANVHYTFKHRAEPWTKVPDPRFGNRFYEVRHIDDGLRALIEGKDMRKLFRPRV